MKKIEVTPLDECCFEIKNGDEYVGVWCHQSTLISVGDGIIGSANSKEELLKRLSKKKVHKKEWVLKEEWVFEE